MLKKLKKIMAMTVGVRRLVCSVALLVALLVAAAAATDLGNTSAADTVLRAMRDELARSVAHLKLDSHDKPYFIEYAVLENESFNISAVFGALVRSSRELGRDLFVRLRIGSYELDNSEMGGASGVFASLAAPPGTQVSLTLDDNYYALRHRIWLATDSAYKEAIEQLARKQAYLKDRIERDRVPDFSREDAVAAIAPRRKLEFDRTEWERKVREWSAILREFPEIHESSVTLRAQLFHKYLVNSEGTKVRQPLVVISIDARASTQAADGMRLQHHVSFHGNSFEDLAPPEEVANAIRQMASELTQLSTAPVFSSSYTGPVLFVGRASAEMFAQLLAPQLSGERAPIGDTYRTWKQLADMMGRDVLPRFLSVYDDPTQHSFDGKGLIGGYLIDDEGVAARRVSLIDQGVLKTLLMSRRPRKGMLRSNGHGRMMASGRVIPYTGNLFIVAEGGKSHAELKKSLIDICRSQNLEFGIVIEVLENPALTDFNPIDGSRTSISRGAAQGESLSNPVLAYKVYADDGREELVRGMRTGAISVHLFKKIVSSSKESIVYNRVSSAGFHSTGQFGIPTTIIAPSVLLEEMDIKPAADAQPKPVLLTHPYFSK